MHGGERGTRDQRGPGRGRGLHGEHPGHGWGGGWGGGGRRRVRRGDVRRAVLAALTDGPANGYEVMGRLEARSGGLWRPSPGSVYPTLQMLEDEGLVRGQSHEGTRVYELTEAGAGAAEAGAAEPGPPPWDRGDAEGRPRGLRDAVAQVAVAARQVAGTGSAEQVDRAVEIVQRARKELYQLLADG